MLGTVVSNPSGVEEIFAENDLSLDVEFVAAFDVDQRKVGLDLAEAIFAEPNCTSKYTEVPATGVTVEAGPILDGLADHVKAEIPLVDDSSLDEDRVAARLREAGAEIVVCQLPGGSPKATRLYAMAAVRAGAAFINCNPEEVANSEEIRDKYRAQGVPLLGDDVKSQLGTTVLHRTLLELFQRRGIDVTSSYQLNFGGNNDFKNMLDRSRFSSKQTSKHSAILAASGVEPDRIELVPPDHIRSLRDHKVAYVQIEGEAFLGMKVRLEVKLQVEDSPNSAGVVIDAIRMAALQRAAAVGGTVAEACSPFFKRPVEQIPEAESLPRLSEIVQVWGEKA
ncbi:inositol-3-phosphate synthase [Nocardia beijingensis]